MPVASGLLLRCCWLWVGHAACRARPAASCSAPVRGCSIAPGELSSSIKKIMPSAFLDLLVYCRRQGYRQGTLLSCGDRSHTSSSERGGRIFFKILQRMPAPSVEREGEYSARSCEETDLTDLSAPAACARQSTEPLHCIQLQFCAPPQGNPRGLSQWGGEQQSVPAPPAPTLAAGSARTGCGR